MLQNSFFNKPFSTGNLILIIGMRAVTSKGLSSINRATKVSGEQHFLPGGAVSVLVNQQDLMIPTDI